MASITFTTVGNTTTTSTQETESTSGSTPITGSGISGNSGTVPTTTPETRALTGTNPFGGSTVDQKAGTRLGDALPKLAEALKAFAELLKSVRDPDMLATLMVEFSGMQRQQALDQRLASRDAAKSQLEGQAAETREAAIKEIAAAAVSLVMAVVSFAVSVGGAAKMGKEVKEGLGASKDVMNAEKSIGKLEEKLGGIEKKIRIMEGQVDSTAKTDALKKLKVEKAATELELTLEKSTSKIKGLEADGHLKKSDIINQYTNAVNTLVKGLSETISGTLRGSGKLDEAQGQVLAANAEDTQADADALKHFMDSIDDLIHTALEFIQKLNDAEVELMASASRL